MDNQNDFIKNWLEGKVSPEELQSRKETGDASVDEFEELITRTTGLKAPGRDTREDAWEKLATHIAAPPKQAARVVTLNRWIPLSIAASVRLLVVAFFVFNKKTITTSLAETTVCTLPDGSEVTLNAGSTIAFSRFGWPGARTVTLEGEAFFQVSKGSTFTVESEAGTVTVLGTSFNVNARPSSYTVACFTGKVKVARGGDDVILTKGMLTKEQQRGLASAETFDDKKTTWRNGDFHFEGVPLRMVMDELERQFNVTIIFSGDGQRLYTGYFSNKDLDAALKMIFPPMSLQYKHENNNTITVQ